MSTKPTGYSYAPAGASYPPGTFQFRGPAMPYGITIALPIDGADYTARRICTVLTLVFAAGRDSMAEDMRKLISAKGHER